MFKRRGSACDPVARGCHRGWTCESCSATVQTVKSDHMDGTEQLDDQLAAWATACSVSLVWTDGTLRLREGDGAVRAAVVFPAEFWPEFCRLTRSAQDAALVSIALSIGR